MDKNLLLDAYLGVSFTDMIIKISKLTQYYNKAKKDSIDLKYTKDLLEDSKEYLKSLKLMNIFSILRICLPSFIPIYSQITTIGLFDNEEIYNTYLEMFNYVYEEINKFEELDRSYVADLIKEIYEDYDTNLPEEYKGHKLSDSTLRISRKEMYKFLKEYGIFLKEIAVYEDGTADYSITFKNTNN